MAKKQAIRPSFYKDFTTKVEEVLEDEKDVDESQQALAYITHFKGWELLKEYKGRLDEFLDEALSTAIQNGATREEIGDRALIKEMAQFVLDSFIDKADAARRAEER